ncbi:putative oxidoreductase, Zn-dependent and NAD(P)-binding [Candidatus Methylobacter favarea]|uniref:Putative oxidoreductase, Zn-dependent and NAD(P)-binding n=1 Tax=Candidatus Methylobacter favarea TaxID=2707345 RepID=A0A8S0YAQ6_9GAMM|nr:NAD(P)-dependent alcohol dehydrogenase [Candidatus Methylobacter favarea]CAA9892367.1 putative oxidoreductase, Zn-dependent and NAD(P)-binding [Candidatus Methylobacter favarea]
MQKSIGYAAHGLKSSLVPFSFERRDITPTDVHIEILYCGVCHSDLHQVRDDWGGTVFPVVPGHEIVGKVAKVGNEVKNFKPGDMAGVGCLVDSCGACSDCQEHLEQFCDNAVFTYNSPDKHTGGITYGGYSNQIVVDQKFVLQLSDKLDPAAAAPLLCAGITTYSPLRHWQVKKGDKVGVVGLGGLGHMAVKFAHAFGAHVVLFTTSAGKTEDAKRLGADEVVISKNSGEMNRHAKSFDFILNTVAAPHNLDAYTTLLKRDGTMCLVGVPDRPHPSPAIASLIFKRRSIAGSLIGGLQETQEMLDFCAEHNITSDIEIIPIQKINEAYERMLKSDVKYRFVIDLASLKSD